MDSVEVAADPRGLRAGRISPRDEKPPCVALPTVFPGR